MRTAVARVNVDPEIRLTELKLAAGISVLRNRGIDVIGADDRSPATGRELEFILPGGDALSVRQSVTAVCVEVFGLEPAVGIVTFISRGTDEDALGVLNAFGATATIRRFVENGEEIAVFTLSQIQARRVPESRLQTALEAALNCEVRIERR